MKIDFRIQTQSNVWLKFQKIVVYYYNMHHNYVFNTPELSYFEYMPFVLKIYFN